MQSSDEMIASALNKAELGNELTELQELVVQQQRELDRCRDELRQVRHLASHDMKEPMRMVSMYLQLLSRRCRGSLDATGEEYLDFALNGARRMTLFLEGLNAYARIQCHTESWSEIDLNQISFK